jgi:hypothetical protein
MKPFFIGLFFCFFGIPSLAQTLEVSSHYPASAYVVQRLLPFAVTNDPEVRVTRVSFGRNPACSTVLDPFYPNTFHLYCYEPGIVDLRIEVESPSVDPLTLELRNLAIALQRPPQDGFEANRREGEP